MESIWETDAEPALEPRMRNAAYVGVNGRMSGQPDGLLIGVVPPMPSVPVWGREAFLFRTNTRCRCLRPKRYPARPGTAAKSAA